jgi:hypothetical protein
MAPPLRRPRVVAATALIGTITFLLLIFATFSLLPRVVAPRPEPPEPPLQPETLAVPFRVAQPWSEATRGYGAIVIDPAYRNEADLRTLGEELRTITDVTGRDAFISVYDDSTRDASKLEALVSGGPIALAKKKETSECRARLELDLLVRIPVSHLARSPET